MKNTALLLCLIIGPPFQEKGVEKPLNWRKLKTEEQVRQAIDLRLPSGIAFPDAEKKLQKEQHVFLQASGDSLLEFMSPEAKATFLISRKWIFRFHFREGKLVKYSASEALTGP
jgi:hypothetical protein